MNYNHLEYFLVLARTQHYTKAAELLHITQPTLSIAMNKLEADLNVTLFEKIGRNVQLTQCGKEFITYIERAFLLINDGVEHIHQLQSDQSNHIRIAFLYSLTADYIPGLIDLYYKTYPNNNVIIDIFESDTKSGEGTYEMIQGLRQGRFDAIFINRIALTSPSEEITPLFDQDYVAILPKTTIYQGKKSIDLSDMASKSLIQYANRYATRNEILDLFSEIGETPKVLTEIDDELSMLALIEKNIGYAIAPMKMIYESRDVYCLPIHKPKYKRTIYLVTRKDINESDNLRNFKNFVMNEFDFSYGPHKEKK
ncbi:LysR family transcriptional regulator [Erysipelothrix urinaevulpis]|uniref:LysR family transcriptional regulator n=1 Tax=Erysipelothrix urinaevulpis TaxID=2683717 RepID=UPI00135781F6|nr:LysR family transcriptional regulator [Erysipelothrix urinaevulpis]